MSSAIETFFQDFEHNSNLSETGALIPQFAEMFLFAGPQGAQVVPANAFALALPRRKKQFEDMGCRSTDLISLRETTLGSHYVMAETEWQMTFAQGEKSLRKSGSPLLSLSIPVTSSQRSCFIYPNTTSWRF